MSGSKVHWDNVPWADAATDRPELEGSSERGEEIVREMNRLEMFVDLSHVSRYPHLFAELLRRGYSDEDLLKIAGRNHLRAMRRMEAVAERSPEK